MLVPLAQLVPLFAIIPDENRDISASIGFNERKPLHFTNEINAENIILAQRTPNRSTVLLIKPDSSGHVVVNLCLPRVKRIAGRSKIVAVTQLFQLYY